jgi:DNA topoisomerase IA
MKLVVAEKPSVARDIARVLKCGERKDGYMQGGDYMVSWALGHLVTLMEPDELDERSRRVQDTGAPSCCASVIFYVESLQNEESMII